jgi:hypothetical protein
MKSAAPFLAAILVLAGARAWAQEEPQVAKAETVTPMLDKDGSWKVSGYFIN